MSESDSPQLMPDENLPVRLVLVDISGTLQNDEGIFPGTLEALATLRATVPALRYVSNDSSESVVAQLKKLRFLGFQIEDNEFLSAVTLTKLYLKIHKLRPLLLLNSGAAEDFGCTDRSQPNCVVVGDCSEGFTYGKLNEALAVLSQPESHLIAIDKSPTKETGHGTVLGTGAFVSALEYGSGKTATLIGKPSRSFWNDAVQSAIEIHEGRNNITSYEQVVMIGDDVINDIIGATDSGINAILVKTGNYRAHHDALCMSSERTQKAIAVAANLTEAVAFIKKLNERE